MKNIILSIHSRHAKKIYSGEKKWEFRKTFPKERIDLIWLYETKPKGLITGLIRFEKHIFTDLQRLWELTNEHAGITEKEFYQYFDYFNYGYAIEVSNFVKLEHQLPLSHFNLNRTPQSWCYVK